MNKYVKSFLHRGLIFSGFGPIISGIVYLSLELGGTHLAINGVEIFVAILSTYFIAFLHAGSSVFPQIESWSKVKAVIFQFLFIYVAYTSAYLINSWIPLNWVIILIYTGAFLGAFVVTWIIILLITRRIANKMNDKLKQMNSSNNI